MILASAYASKEHLDPEFVKLVDEMIEDQPETDFWDAYTAME